jgi:3-oxoacyl-[acyl-carrier-protein] synthase III
MALSEVEGVRLVGLATAVPSEMIDNTDASDSFSPSDVQKLVETTGVRRRRVADGRTCTSDLCLAASQRLLHELSWTPDSVDALILVTQTPDYVLPATSCVLQDRLQLSKRCAAFDINLGCSGYVYGLWVASRLVSARGVRRVLLLVGDTITRLTAPQDRSTALLFGDAGTATALEYCDDAPRMVFSLGTDGGGAAHLQVPAGGFRRPRDSRSAQRTVQNDGNVRGDQDLYMNGAEIFAFTLGTVPTLIQQTLDAAAWTIGTVDQIVMHQANQFMLQHIARRLKLPRDKWILDLEDHGNTSSASIPLGMANALRDRLQNETLRLLLAGFGVGLSWGAVALPVGPIVIPPQVSVEAGHGK